MSSNRERSSRFFFESCALQEKICGVSSLVTKKKKKERKQKKKRKAKVLYACELYSVNGNNKKKSKMNRPPFFHLKEQDTLSVYLLRLRKEKKKENTHK